MNELKKYMATKNYTSFVNLINIEKKVKSFYYIFYSYTHKMWVTVDTSGI